MVLFSLGVVVVFAASMRAYWSHHVTQRTYDVSWEGFYLWIWTAVEANLGVICGSIPALRPLFKSMFSSKSSSYDNKTSTAYRSGTAAQVANNQPKGVRTWTDTLKRGSRGIKIEDDHIDIEGAAFEMKLHKDRLSPASSRDTWSGREQRLPDNAHGPLS